jgi:hypothetical protein
VHEVDRRQQRDEDDAPDDRRELRPVVGVGELPASDLEGLDADEAGVLSAGEADEAEEERDQDQVEGERREGE